MGLMKKPVAAALDWFWDRFTGVVMNQGRSDHARHHQRLLTRPAAADGAGPDGADLQPDEAG